MPGHPDWDASVNWQATPLYFQANAPFPAAGTVLFSGPVTNYPSLLLRCFAFTGGVKLNFQWYQDAALTQNSGSDQFDAPQNEGFYALYEVQAPFVKISVSAVTVAPAGVGEILIMPSRAAALGFRPLVTPQQIILNNVTIPANTTNTYLLKFIVIGNVQWKIITLGTASALTAVFDTQLFDGSQGALLFPGSTLIAGATVDFNMIAQPARLQITNTTGAPATITMVMVSQQQGW